MKLSTWASCKGITYRAAWKLFRAGKIEDAWQEQETGYIFVGGKPQRRSVIGYLKRGASAEERKRVELAVRKFARSCHDRGIVVETSHYLSVLRTVLQDARNSIIVTHVGALDVTLVRLIEAALKAADRTLVVKRWWPRKARAEAESPGDDQPSD